MILVVWDFSNIFYYAKISKWNRSWVFGQVSALDYILEIKTSALLGYSLGGTSVTGAALDPYIQQAIDQINFVIGDPAKSAPAALRASLGHPKPFNLRYVEIGNEDNIGNAPGTYQNRWNLIVTKLKATFPQLHWFQSNSFFYDSFPRDGTTYFEGEYAAISTNDKDVWSPVGRLTFPTVRSAVGEAAFMTGLERNADIVQICSGICPLVGARFELPMVGVNISLNGQGNNKASFSSNTIHRSTSFYVQKLFSVNKGDEYLPSTLPVATGTLFWSVTRRISTKEIIIKISNNAVTTADITFVLPTGVSAVNTARAEILTGPTGASNSPATPNIIVPYTITVPAGQTFNYTAPALSVSVLTVVVQ
ncbi:hypothetical protein H0H81_010982 [Sphagnurus paluster]|uniref:non-reducing end alpha-L-arabinofuranosidase n=1 Tax=Sphagnurus paluster TaxID=117069 RepID=A0A9P7K3U9_9AGAR|nr:hypothetical protein H0H81_010982 [Sphagnurus paluster]